MIPQTGQHVKIILRNGAMAEGIVEEWFANEVQLKSLDGESILIITHPTEDIMLIKVFLEKPVEEKEPEDYGPTIEEVREFEGSFQEVADKPVVPDPFDPNQNLTLAQLRIAKMQQERKIIAEKLKDHSPNTGPGKVQYGYPGLGKKPRTK
jgi:hypothetical protein